MKKEIFVKTTDNVKIFANHYTKSSEAVVIVAPGWCMTKDSKAFLKISEMFFKDYDVLSFDFRGHGKSSGTFTFTAKELYDIEALVKYAKTEGYKKIYLAGFSLGAAIVLICASKNLDINKVIAISAPSEFGKIEAAIWKKAAWYETFKKFELKRYLSLRMNLIPQKKIKPIDIIKKISVPTLFIAGEKDPTVYAWHTELLYEEALCKKKYKLFKNGYHAEDLFLHFPDEFSRICLDWLKN